MSAISIPKINTFGVPYLPVKIENQTILARLGPGFQGHLALSPELHQLVTQWDTLPSEIRGELAGYAVGKLGTDLLAPGVVAKIASKSVNSAKELVAVCKNLQIAQETLILETAAGIGIPAKVAEIVEMGKKTAMLGEELGFTAQEIGQLQKAGKLEKAVSCACEHLTPSGKKSFELFDRAQEFLKPYKEFMPELQARELDLIPKN